MDARPHGQPELPVCGDASPGVLQVAFDDGQQEQQDIRRKMCEDHRIHKSDTLSKPASSEGRDTCQKVRSHEDTSQCGSFHAKSNMKPIGQNALHDKAAAKSIESKKHRQFEDNSPRPVQAP